MQLLSQPITWQQGRASVPVHIKHQNKDKGVIDMRKRTWRVSPALRLRSEKWMDVQVGDIIKLENNQFVTVSHYKIKASTFILYAI